MINYLACCELRAAVYIKRDNLCNSFWSLYMHVKCAQQLLHQKEEKVSEINLFYAIIKRSCTQIFILTFMFLSYWQTEERKVQRKKKYRDTDVNQINISHILNTLVSKYIKIIPADKCYTKSLYRILPTFPMEGTTRQSRRSS